MDKETEVRRSLMAHMRRLASLFTCTFLSRKRNMVSCPSGMVMIKIFLKEGTLLILEMLLKPTHHWRQMALRDVKAGLKNALYCLLKAAAKILKEYI